MQTTRAISLFGYYSLNSAHGDTSGAGADITTPGNIKADYGRTTFDVKSRIFLAGSITLPKFIQLSPFMIQQSGTPYNITTGSDNNYDTFFNSRPDLVTGVATANGSTIKTIAGMRNVCSAGPGGRRVGCADQLLHRALGVHVQPAGDQDVWLWCVDAADQRCRRR